METKHTKNQEYKLEVCANTINSAISAQKGGADRIELCTNILQGGTTPSYGTIVEVRNRVNLDIIVLIRPREGNFVYANSEFEIMQKDIEMCVKLGCRGIATAILTNEGTIDKERNKILVTIAKSNGLETTFHRAIDRTQDIVRSTEEIIELGFDRILTSGGYPTVQQGIDNILKINKLFDKYIKIMPGGGITPENIAEIANRTKAKEFHGTFSSTIEDSNSWYNPNMDDQNWIVETNIEKVKAAKRQLYNINY